MRDNVIMRKITFGNRSLHGNGQRNHEVLMSLIQTARQLNLNPLTFLHLLLTKPAAAAAALVKRLGAQILEISFLIELGFLGGREKLKDYPVRSLVVY